MLRHIGIWRHRGAGLSIGLIPSEETKENGGEGESQWS